MYLLTDLTMDFPATFKITDTKDINDIVVGITGSLLMARSAEIIAANMRFGDEYISPNNFMLHNISDIRG